MYIYLTGGTGYFGSYLLQALLRHGHRVRCLIHSKPSKGMDDESVDTVKGSITDPASLDGTMNGCDAVIHLVGILEEHPSKGITFEAIHDEGTRHVVGEAVRAGISTFIQMSANGARPDGVSGYQTSKWRGEEHVRAAGFDHWTIFRPSVLFGDPGPDHPEFAKQLATSLIDPFPILPIFGDGGFKMQPVHVTEVASAFAQALESDAANGQSYCVAGQDTYPYIEVVDRITKALGHDPKPKAKTPLWLVRPAVHSIGKLGLLPISPDQFEMLVEGNTCDSTAFYRDFDLDPVPFTVEHLAYVKQYV